MDYLKEYRSFINSHYLAEGVRISAGVLVPVLLLSHFGLLPIGITIAMGALCVSVTDNPGPILHRRNGLIACTLIVFLVSLITGLTCFIPWLFFIVLPVFCFFFSMIGVYGARAGAIGIGALLVMVLQYQHHYEGWEMLYNSLYVLAGGVWYTLLSLALYTLRPYKLIQQALGEFVMAAAEYLRAKSSFYEKDVDYEESYRQLLSKQIAVQEKQNLVAELIFKTRSIVKESTHTSRVLMMVFLDVSDLFERTMTSHQDYDKLHHYFDNTGILKEYHELILELSDELDTIGIALKSGRPSGQNPLIEKDILKERDRLQQLRLTEMDTSNIEGFISLRHILDSIDDIAGRIKTLHHYTSYDRKLRRKKIQTPDPEDFISHQDFDPKLLVDNLSFRSNIFRHSLRITLAALSAFLVALFLPVGHGYWILLTSILILKPAYSLTRKRNIQRLTGTVIGAIIGVGFLYVVKDKTVIIIALATCMILAYSFMRTQYLISVLMVTLYVLFMFRLLDPGEFKDILADRVIDTLIGSAIAFVFGFLLAPIWEHEQVDEFMTKLLQDNIEYYRQVATVFTGTPADQQEIRVARKNSWVSLANLSDAFTRMLSEPKSKQKNIQQLHQFVVSNHMLTSHIATLAYYIDSLQQQYIMDDYKPLINASVTYLEQSLQMIKSEEQAEKGVPQENTQVHLLDQKINVLMRKRQEEIAEGKIETDTRITLSEFKSITDQFYFIYKITNDIQKISAKLSSE